jgi:dTDP-4-dehydrorhamnose 3,5-epimerase
METPSPIPQVVLHEFTPTDELQAAETIWRTSINGLFAFANPVYKDERGSFTEAIRLWEILQVTGLDLHIVQANFSVSKERVLRGIHAEGWNKFVFVSQGSALCALVDLRKDSNTFLHVELITLESNTGLVIPIGVGNSFCVTSGALMYTYLVDRKYENRDKSGDVSLDPFDPDLGIPWPFFFRDMVLSQRDLQAISLREFLQQQI